MDGQDERSEGSTYLSKGEVEVEDGRGEDGPIPVDVNELLDVVLEELEDWGGVGDEICAMRVREPEAYERMKWILALRVEKHLLVGDGDTEEEHDGASGGENGWCVEEEAEPDAG